jgi:UDP-glucose 4-epimerase
MKKLLVTGGAGFIGSHVADRFLGMGHEVVILDDLSTGKRRNIPGGARFEECDIRDPRAAELVKTGGFDVIAHLAAQMDVRRSVADPMFDASVNVIGTLNLLEAARTLERRPRFVFASTGGALYGDFVATPTPEEAAKDPDAPYGVAKLSVEHYLAYYGRIHGFGTMVLRFGNVYGPRQDPHGEAGVIAIFCQRILAGKPVTIFGDGTQTRDYVYVGDVAEAFVRAALGPIPDAGPMNNRSCNVGTALETSVLELAERLRRLSGRHAEISFAPARAGELMRSCLEVSKSRRVLEWEAKVPLEEGLSKTLAWFAGQSNPQS